MTVKNLRPPFTNTRILVHRCLLKVQILIKGSEVGYHKFISGHLTLGSTMQDPLRGGKDELFDHLVSVIHAGDKDALEQDAMAPPRRRLVPELLLKLARSISPF